MRRLAYATAAFVSLSVPASAQSWAPWNQDYHYRGKGDRRGAPRPEPSPWFFFYSDPGPRIRLGPALLEGGPRPAISPMAPASVPFRSTYASGTVVIDTSGRALYLVTSSDSAMRYPISVGREGFTWTGTEKISRIADWPDWHPPAEMRVRDPRLPERMTGGVRNPLGAKALYLGNSLYRIHGTNDASSIGRAASSGCFRMMNGHVVDLAERVGVGTTVVVVSRLPSSTLADGPVARTSATR